MLTIILAVILGVIFTFLSVNNSQTVNLNLVNSSYGFPLYVIISLSFLAGTLLASIITLFDRTSNAFDSMRKENNYKNTLDINEKLRAEVTSLNNEVVSLKKDNNELRSEIRNKNFDQKRENIKEFFAKIAHPGSSQVNDRVTA